MKTKSKTLAKWSPPQTAQNGDGDWKVDDDVAAEADDDADICNDDAIKV